MGLNSKQVSIDGFDWSKALLQSQKLELPKLPNSGGVKRSQPSQNQNEFQPPEQLNCPRCDSSNTKFCYYNNYNKSQPRHFCRACKRHWTKGGTLRNVPVGGGRKNKRLKKSTTTTSKSSAVVAATTTTTTTTKSNIDGVLNSQMNLSDILYQGLVFPASVQNFKVAGGNWPGCENFITDYGIINTQMSIQPQNPNFSAAVSSSTSFEAKQSPISNSNICNYSDQDFTTPISTHPWQPPPPMATTEIPSCYWSWDEIDTFAATDLNIPWDDKDSKP